MDHLPTTSKCHKCGETKDISCFSIRGEGKKKNRINIYCKSCINEDRRVLNRLKKTAPPVPEVCDCCGEKPKGRLKKTLCLDHCHETNTFRGWLCDNCNVSISRAGDTLEGVTKIYQYMLKQSNNGQS